MSSVVRLTDAPPCPTCGHEVQELATEDTGADFVPDIFRLTGFSKRTYTLRPCFHDVMEFTCTADRVLEWRLTPARVSPTGHKASGGAGANGRMVDGLRVAGDGDPKP